MKARTAAWIAALALAVAAFVYGSIDEGPPRTNADRAHELAQDFACPVCSGQSVAESDVPVAREIRRQIAVWVDEGRSDDYIRNQLVAAYDADVSYNPSGSGVTSLVWILPLVAGAGIAAVLVVMLRSGRRRDMPVAEGGVRGSLTAKGRDSRADERWAAGLARGSRRWRNAAVWTVAVLVVAVAAGVLVARSSGSRGADGSITGDIRTTTREMIFEAQSRLGDGDLEGAIAAYDEALDLQPSNVEALTYRGWLTSQTGDNATAARLLDDAIGVDPDYPDARLFRAIVALQEGDAARATEEIAAFDELDPPPYAEALIEQAQVRRRINAAALEAVEKVYDGSVAGTTFAESELSLAEIMAAAEAMASQGRLLNALMLLDWAGEPSATAADAAVLLAARGWLLARAGDPELLTLGIEALDEALSIDPTSAEALVYRAFAHLAAGDAQAARADLAAFDALDDQPAHLLRLISEGSLREALTG